MNFNIDREDELNLLDVPRGSGKTYLLVEESKKTGIPIIVFDEKFKNYLKEKNKEIEIYTLEEYIKLKEKPKEIYIDEGIEVLKRFLNRNGTEIKIMSTSTSAYNHIGYLKLIDLRTPPDTFLWSDFKK